MAAPSYYTNNTYSPEYMLQRQREEHEKQRYLAMAMQNQLHPQCFDQSQLGQQAVVKPQPNKKLLLLNR